MIVSSEFVMNDRAVFAVDHENGLFDLHTFNFISKNRKRIDTKSLEILESLRMDNPRVTIGREFESLSLDE